MKEFFHKYFKYILAVLACLGVALCLFLYLTSFNYLAESSALKCSRLVGAKVTNDSGRSLTVYYPWCFVSLGGKVSLYNLLQPNKLEAQKASLIVHSIDLQDAFKGPAYLVMDSETINNKVINQLLWQEGFADSASSAVIKLKIPETSVSVCGDITINDSQNLPKIFVGGQEIPLRQDKDKYYFCTAALAPNSAPILNVVIPNSKNFKSFKMKLYWPPASEGGRGIPVFEFITQHDYFLPFNLSQLSFPL